MAYSIAGGNVGPQIAGGHARGGLPPMLPGAGSINANANMPGMRPAGFSGFRVPGILSPNDLGAVSSQVQSLFGRLSDLPPDNPFAQYLVSIGFADAMPGAFPERDLRQQLRRGSLQSAASLFAGSPGNARGVPAFGGGGRPMEVGAMPGFPGGGGGRGGINVSALLNPKWRSLPGGPAAPAMPGMPSMPGRIGAMDLSGLQPEPGQGRPAEDPLMTAFRRFVGNR